MTRKDYEVIASAWKAISATYRGDTSAEKAIHHSVQEIADSLERNNPRFNRDKFIAACGVQNCTQGGA